MLFNTYTYVFLFLPASWLLYCAVLRWRPQWLFPAVTLISTVFIAASGARSALILCVSVAVNYVLLRLLRPGARAVMLTGVIFNLGYLAYFKYAGFFLSNLAQFCPGVPVLQVVLPVGISFYTFQKITVLLDRYQGRVEVGGFWDYALFVSFFPQLIAGPIVHYRDLVPQFQRPASVILGHIRRVWVQGAGLFILGLAKKVIVADFFASYADPIFADPAKLSAGLAWKAAISYSLQIYFDFSGYVDMAIGAALAFGVILPINFNSPYRAVSFIDFWHRWHITLSTFMRDYLYIPMGGSRRGFPIQVRNLFLTMLIGGLWHGAAWGFVLWGALHGVLLCANHLVNRAWPDFKCPRLIATPAVLLVATALWVPFRAVHLSDTLGFWCKMANVAELKADFLFWASSLTSAQVSDPGNWVYDDVGLLWGTATLLTMAVVWLTPNSGVITERIGLLLAEQPGRGPQWKLGMVGFYLGLIFVLSVMAMAMHRPAQFIYFQF